MNIIRTLSFALLLSFLSIAGLAQDKVFTAADAAFLNYSLYAERLPNLQWQAESDNFTYLASNYRAIIKGNANKDGRDTLFTLDDVNGALNKAGLDSMRYIAGVRWNDTKHARLTANNSLMLYDLENNQMEKLNSWPEDVENVDVSPKSNIAAFTRENNLFISKEGKEFAVSNDDNKGVVYGHSDVHRNEFGIEKGTFWSPNGQKLAFYRMDESMVAEYPLVDITTRIAEEKPIRYPMAGMKSHQVTLGVYDVKSAKTIYLETGEPKEQYLTNITWSPDGDYIYIAVLNRGQDHLKLNRYDAANGELVNTLFEENAETWVEPEHGPYFLNNKTKDFVWFSERDGYNHLYLYSQDGELKKQLTTGEWVVTEIAGQDAKGENLFIATTKDSPIQQQIYKLNIKNGSLEKLTQAHGTHSAQVAHSGKYLIDSYSSTDVPRIINVLSSKGKIVQNILTAPNPLEDYKLGEMEIATLKADNGDDLYYRLIKPADFEEGKKYPVFLYVYGGPHSQLVNDTWLGGAGIFLNYMAQQGYVVFTLDNHGTANRGFEFESMIHRNLGQQEVKDQMVGVEYLKSLDFVDADRMGVDGWSYGGFMTISMVLNHPEVFKAASCGGPVIDWKYYEIMYGERYMDTPEENPEGYDQARLSDKAGELKTDLLVMHCTTDPVVVWQNSLSFIQACIEEGIQLDYFIYPGHEHNVRGKDRAHLIQKITDHMNDNLK